MTQFFFEVETIFLKKVIKMNYLSIALVIATVSADMSCHIYKDETSKRKTSTSTGGCRSVSEDQYSHLEFDSSSGHKVELYSSWGCYGTPVHTCKESQAIPSQHVGNVYSIKLVPGNNTDSGYGTNPSYGSPSGSNGTSYGNTTQSYAAVLYEPKQADGTAIKHWIDGQIGDCKLKILSN